MAIGRPIELTPNIATKNISSLATADQTEFTVTGGYRINEIAVYRNGVRLAEGRDFTASDGDTVNLVTAATVDDVIEFAVFDSFNVSDAIVSAASSQNLNGDFNVTGSLYAGNFEPTQLIVGVVTASTAFHVGSALTSNAAGDVETIGIITAATFKGDGSGLTGIGETVNVRTETITVSGVSTFTGVSNFSAAVNVDATTDSTSSTTGALIVDGGLGVAKNVYIGAGLSVAGTLTYEDVTNVDSVGLITAKSGVNVSGGQLIVGSGLTIGNAGVATFADGSATANGLHFGTDGDLKLYHNGSNAHIKNATGNFTIDNTSGDLVLQAKAGENSVYCVADAAVNLYYNNGKTLETTANGVTIYDDGKDDEARLIVQGGEGNAASLYLYADDGDDNADKWRMLSLADGSLSIQNYASGSWETNIEANGDGNVELNYNNSKKFETTNDGTVTTGIATVTNLHSGSMDCTGELNFTGNGEKFIDVATLNGSNSLTIRHQDGGSYETAATFTANGAAVLQFNGGSKFSTTNEGARVIGFTSTTAGMGVTGGLFEGSFIKAGKLSDNATLGISTANFFYFTTQETTTATPNIVWNDSYSLSSKMAVGDVASVTVVTTAAAGGYSANWTIDGNAVTEEWVGGAAPSAGGADGLDIYSLTIIKTGTGTGDSGFKVIANLSNAT